MIIFGVRLSNEGKHCFGFYSGGVVIVTDVGSGET